MTIDQNTGLPQLPEGFFWRVTHPLDPGGYWGGYSQDTTKLQVLLMEQLPDEEAEDKRSKLIRRLFPLETTWEPQAPGVEYAETCQGTSNQAIVNAAYRVLKRQRRDESLSSKLGDYPPKKLEK